MALNLTLTESFAVPPERVFDALAHPEETGKWMPNIVRIERLTEGPLRVGAQFRETRKMFGKESTEFFEVTALEPGRTLELFFDGTKGTSGRGRFVFRYDLAAAATGSTLTLSGTIDGMGVMGAILGRLVLGPMMRKALAKDLTALKAYVERAR